MEDIQKENQRMKDLVENLASQKFEQKKEELRSEFPNQETAILDCEGPSQLEAVERVLRTEFKQPKSKGVVSLLPKPKKNAEIWTKEYSNPNEFVHAIYEAYRNESDKAEKDKLRNALESFGSIKMDGEALKKLSFEIPYGVESEAVADLGKNFTFAQYKEWSLKKAKREQQNV